MERGGSDGGDRSVLDEVGRRGSEEEDRRLSEDDRRFSDEEVARILRLAVQPSAKLSELPVARPTEGLTLAELESAAGEAGIDPRRVRRIALTLADEDPLGDRSLLLGPHPSHVFDRTIEGEVPAEKMSELVAAIRRLTRVQGKVTEVGDWLEWSSDASTIHISVKPDAGRTRFQLMGDAGFKLVGILGPTTLATLISIVALGNAGELSIGLAGGIIGGAAALARGAWEWVGRRASEKYRRLADALSEEIERLSPPEG